MGPDRPLYKRILLKLSGESLLGSQTFGLEFERINQLAREIRRVHDVGVQVAIMIGGGNIFRGFQGEKAGFSRAAADQMGLLATIINGIALQEALEKEGIACRHLSALEIRAVAEPFIRRRAIRHLEKGRVVVLSAGLGSPFFTTDTAAALRALEIGAEVILKATKVDGVYSADPLVDSMARFYEQISYEEVLAMQLKVMDATAISLCREFKLPIVVFNVNVEGNILRAVLGEKIGTLIIES
ncbi:MAG: UMP kinase [Candidatus Aminicenantes bacterium]|nr:UMP kinase [Candidatus Aminicenantes bacterium]